MQQDFVVELCDGKGLYVRLFRVSIWYFGLCRIVRVIVYLDVDFMCWVVCCYNEFWMDNVFQFIKVFGICYVVDIWQIGVDGFEKCSLVVVYICFCEQVIGMGVVIYEVIYVVMVIYNQDCLERDGMVYEDLLQEEMLCYLVGDLMVWIVNKMYEFGYYGKDENV